MKTYNESLTSLTAAQRASIRAGIVAELETKYPEWTANHPYWMDAPESVNQLEKELLGGRVKNIYGDRSKPADVPEYIRKFRDLYEDLIFSDPDDNPDNPAKVDE